jgi:uncharacterized membrane protein YccC
MISRKDGSSTVVGGTLPAPARPPPTTAGSEPAALAADQILGFRLPRWLDPVSALIGLKTAVGVVIAQTVALWMDWSPTGATLAVLMLQQTYFGRTLARAVLRMLGALIGSVVGLLILHLLVQERALMILTVSLLGGVIIYMQQGARHPYAWLFGGFSLMLLTFGNVDQPEGAFEAAVAWVSGNALGITVVLVMHGVLWPHTGERQFNALLQTILRDSARLFRIKIVNLLQDQAPSQEIGHIENALIEAMPQLRLALRIAGHETGRVAALRPDYELLIEEVQALVSLVITLGESLKICRQAPVVMAAIERSGAAQQVVAILDTELQTLAGDVARGELGAQAGSRDAPLSRVHALADELFEALRARQHDLDMAALAAALAKMIELAVRVAAIQETLALQAQPYGIEVAGQRLRALTPRPLYLGLVSDRWRKAIATSLVIAGSAMLWIVTNWPEPGKMILFAFTAPALGALVPQFPLKALVRSLIYGPVIGAILYFGIMPRLADMWQLAPFLILALFPCGYLVNSANPASSITAMMSGIWILELINLSQGQIYPFSSFAGSLLGIVGAVAVAVAVISLVDAPIPERRFRNHVRGFFAICEQIAREMAALTPGEPAGPRLQAGKSRQMEQLRMCHMWWSQLDHERFSEEERHKAGLLMAAMRALAFRQDALEHARLTLPAVSSLAGLGEPAAELRARARRAYGILEKGAARCEPAAPVPAISELAGPYQAWLATLRSIPATDPNAKDLVRAGLVLIGLHHALVYAVHECHARFDALDWRLWGEAHF